jgi:hypothetical protein
LSRSSLLEVADSAGKSIKDFFPAQRKLDSLINSSAFMFFASASTLTWSVVGTSVWALSGC